jgi:uncharacterized protein
MSTSAEHPNVAVVRRFYECYAHGDLDTLRKELVAPDVIWRIPGHHPLAGAKHGVDEVAAFFAQLAKSGFRAEVVFLGANDEYVVDCHRGWGENGGMKIDMLWCLLYRIRNGRIVEVQNFAADQHAADAFFWHAYPLKPIPGRIAEA